MASTVARVFARRISSSPRRADLSKFYMPAMSPTMSEGGIAQWKKKEGESYAQGDVLLEIETDKATIDVEAQEDGVLAKIIADAGAKNIAVGTPIAIIAEQGDDLSGAAQLAAQSASERPKAEESKRESEPPKAPEQAPQKNEPKSSPPPTESKAALQKGNILFASPVAKKIALERGIPLAKVKGSGPNGRILREDVEKYKLEASALDTSAPKPATPTADYVDIPVTNMRRTIGTRLTQSKQELPHYYVTVDIDMGKTLKLRELFNSSLAEKGGKLSVNDFIVKAAACALSDVPEANSAWLGEVIRQYSKSDISIAVATPNGLITPIVKDVGSKGLTTISAEAKALAKKAREGKLTPSDYQGGTFTISNLGMYDVSHFTAIINPPQACILAIGSTAPTLVPSIEDERGFKVVQIMKATLSSDHRVVDGAIAARWMHAFKGYLENPLTFML